MDNYVVYGLSGLCRIIGLKRIKTNKGESDFFVLKPLSAPDETVYIDTQNEILTKKMRPVVSREEIFELIEQLHSAHLPWISDTRERRLSYYNILSSGNRLEQLALIKSLYERRAELTARKKKLWVMDEKALKSAENIIFTEFAVVLGISPDEVPDLIASVPGSGEGGF